MTTQGYTARRLNLIGYKQSLSGYRIFQTAITDTVRGRKSDHAPLRIPYDKLSQKYKKTPNALRHNMDYAFHNWWKHADTDKLKQCFPDYSPRNYMSLQELFVMMVNAVIDDINNQ